MQSFSLLVLLTGLALWSAAHAADDAFPLLKDQNETAAANLVRSETSGITLPGTDVVVGTGRVAQMTRRWTLRFEVLVAGRPARTAEVQLLVPALSGRLDRSVIRAGDVHDGKVPSSVLMAVAGMRVGGVRRITVPASQGGSFPKPPPSSLGHPTSAENMWKASIKESTEFVDGRTGVAVLELPIDEDAVVVARLLEVCRPHYEIATGHTIIDVNRYRTLRVGSCD